MQLPHLPPSPTVISPHEQHWFCVKRERGRLEYAERVGKTDRREREKERVIMSAEPRGH